MATTSACAVGSFAEVTLLAPLPTICPPFTTTAPKGPPLPDATFSTERRMASFMNLFLSSMFCFSY